MSFSYHPYLHLNKDPAIYMTSLFNPGRTVYMHFWLFLKNHVNALLLLCACRVETCHVNIASLLLHLDLIDLLFFTSISIGKV